MPVDMVQGPSGQPICFVVNLLCSLKSITRVLEGVGTKFFGCNKSGISIDDIIVARPNYSNMQRPAQDYLTMILKTA